MKKSIRHYRDLRSICVETLPLLPGAAQCVVRSGGINQAHLMLFADGIVSIFSIRPDPADDDVADALARVVLRHASRHAQPGVDLIVDIKAQGADPCPGLGWDDLAVGVSAPRSAGKVTCYPLSTRTSAALVLSTDDPIMPVSAVAVTPSRVSRPLSIA